MRIALLISGRAARYEVCLLDILKRAPSIYEFDLFMSINDEDCEYYTTMKEELANWLKGIRIQPFSLPDPFPFDLNHNSSLHFHHRIIDGKHVPYNQMSMYYNDMKAFEMACKYENENNIKYDLFMKFRSDICSTSMPITLEKIGDDELKLYSIVPQCNMQALGKHRVQIVSDAWAWSNKKTMSIYCNTYNYVYDQLLSTNGRYLVHYESGVTDNIYDNCIHVQYVNNPYKLDRNRRILEKPVLTNLAPVSASLPPMDIQSVKKLDLPADPL